MASSIIQGSKIIKGFVGTKVMGRNGHVLAWGWSAVFRFSLRATRISRGLPLMARRGICLAICFSPNGHIIGGIMEKRSVSFLILMLSVIVIVMESAALSAPLDSGSAIDKGYWQYEVETGTDLVRLIIRDKAGQVGTYKAVFVVTGPDKQQYRYQKKGSGNSPLVVRFPNDFSATWTKGTYIWTCSIGERELLHGSFEYCKACQIRLLQANFSPDRFAKQ